MTTQTIIKEYSVDNGAINFEIQHGKKESSIRIDVDNSYIQIICKNAAHSAYRGTGKFFDTLDEAEKNYKSKSMKEMIQTVKKIIIESAKKAS